MSDLLNNPALIGFLIFAGVLLGLMWVIDLLFEEADEHRREREFDEHAQSTLDMIRENQR